MVIRMNGNLQLMWVHLQNTTEPCIKGGIQERIEVTLAVAYSNGDMEAEKVTSYRNSSGTIETPTHP